MATSKNQGFEPRTYKKGKDERVANTAERAVALEFDGYTRVETKPEESAAPKADGPVPTAPKGSPKS